MKPLKLFNYLKNRDVLHMRIQMYLKDFWEFKVPILFMDQLETHIIQGVLLEGLQEEKDLRSLQELLHSDYAQTRQDQLEYQLLFAEFMDLNQLEAKDFQSKVEWESQEDKQFQNKIQGPSIPGLDTSFGYLTRSVQDLEWLCSKTLGKSLNYNPSIFGTWNKQLYEQSKYSKKRFGLISSTHQIDLAPAVKNVLRETAELLREQGHEVVEFEFPYLHHFRNFFFKVLNNVGFINAMRLRIEGEFPMPQNETSLNRFNGTFLGRKYKVFTSRTELERQKFKLYDIGSSSLQLMMLLKERDFWQQEYNKAWQKSRIDLLISPTMPFTAPYHGQTQSSIHQLTFTAFQNILQLPAGHVPVRLVQKNETQYDDMRLYGSEVRKSIQNSQGLPVGVQITGEFMRDEVVIGAMWQLQEALGRKLHLPQLD